MPRILAFLCFVLFVGSVSPLSAQEVSGRIEGRVLDSDGDPLADVGVVVRGSSLQGERQAISDASGHFLLAALPVGSYEVTLRHTAYHEVALQQVEVRLGRTTTLDELRLQVRTLETPPVVVYGERPLLDPTTTTTGGVLSKTAFERLPTERNYRSILTLLPQSNASYYGDEANVGGATGLENMYFIDGINVTDPYRGLTGTNLPYNFVEEIELKRGGYEAEFGRALGGIVNVVTGTGSNEFGGTAFGYYSGDALSGDRRLGVADVSVEDFSTYDVGFSASGPLVADRLWYYVAYDREWAKQDVQVPGFGSRPDDRETDMFAGKLTWKVDDDTEMSLTALADPSERSKVGPYSPTSGFPSSLGDPDPVLGFEETGGYNVALAARTFVGDRLLIDASASIYDREENNGGATERGRTEPLFVDLTTGEWSGGYGTFKDVKSERWSVQASATAFLGRHTLKGGLGYEDTEIGIVNFTTGVGNIRYTGSGYIALTFGQDTQSRAETQTLYLQDSWRVSDRMRLNFGLRWDGVSWFGYEGRRFVRLTDQFQPRLGLTYELGPAGTQQIFASAGRFYQQYPMFLPALWYAPFDNRVLRYDADVDPRVDPDGYYAEFQYGTDDPTPPELGGLEGEHSDELALGYERRFAGTFKASVIGTYRTLRNAVRTGIDPDTGALLGGNPGQGSLDFLPPATRDYRSLELTLARSGGARFDFLASWVISRNEGNAPGLYDSDHGTAAAGNSISLRLVEQVPNSTGLLPNDRTHVVKLYGAYRFGGGVTLGLYGSWMQGTPLNQFGASSLGLQHNVFLVRRGSAGREASIWDLNARLQWLLGRLGQRAVAPRLIVDLLHIASAEQTVWTDQVRYLGVDDGVQTLPNPNYGKALGYQPPMTVRLGMEVAF